MEFLALQPVGFLTPNIQIALIVVLFVLSAWQQYREVKKTGKMYGTYPPSLTPLLAPVYEEILFRGFILSVVLALASVPIAIIVSSVLFGVWHFKNLFWDTKRRVITQVLYTGCMLGPILAVVTLWTGSIWIAIILHQINNLWAPLSKDMWQRFRAK